MADIEITDLTVEELKEELRNRNLDSTGKKVVLQERLRIAMENEGRGEELTSLRESITEEGDGSMVLEVCQYTKEDGDKPDKQGDVMAMLHAMMTANEATRKEDKKEREEKEAIREQREMDRIAAEKKEREEKEAIKERKDEEYKEDLLNKLDNRIEEKQEVLLRMLEAEKKERRENHADLVRRLETKMAEEKEEQRIITETIERHLQDMNCKQGNMEIRLNTQETEIKGVKAQINEKIKSLQKEVKEEIKKETETKLEDHHRAIFTNRKDIDELKKRTEKDITTSYEVMDQQVRKVRIELNNEIKQNKKEIDEITRNTGQRNAPIQVPGQQFINCHIDEGQKFNGDIRKLHPKIFLQVIRNKIKNYINFEDKRELIRSHITGMAQIWFTSKEFDLKSFEDFERAFLRQYWGEVNQGQAREILYNGKYDQSVSSMSNHALLMYTQAKFLDPAIREEQIVTYIARHFKSEIAEMIAINTLKTFEQMTDYLVRVEQSLQRDKMYNNYSNQVIN